MKIAVAFACLISLLLRRVSGLHQVNISISQKVGLPKFEEEIPDAIFDVDQDGPQISDNRNLLCGTRSLCGKKGGFCIPNSETCKGITLTGPDYCYEAKTGSCKCCLGPTVYMSDIEETIAEALRYYVIYKNENEFRDLNKQMLDAVSDFTKVLKDHLPLSADLRTFLTHLDVYLNQHNTLGGNTLLSQYSRLPGKLPERRFIWIGCFNLDLVRSYPCGVWTIFHVITVNLFSNPVGTSKILPALYGMVNYFPWCDGCRTHFEHMYKGHGGIGEAKNMQGAKDVTMWLWEAHNLVTERVRVNGERDLPEGRSELQFPGKEQCNGCTKPQPSVPDFIKDRVLDYLKKIYARSAIEY